MKCFVHFAYLFFIFPLSSALGEYKHCDDEVIEKHCDDNSKDWAKKYLSYLRLSLYKDYCNEQGIKA